MFGSFGWMELLLILIIVLIIFGAGKLPQLGEGLGKAIKGFKKTVHEADAIDVTRGADTTDSTTDHCICSRHCPTGSQTAAYLPSDATGTRETRVRAPRVMSDDIRRIAALR